MSKDYEGVSPEAALLATMHKHLSSLRLALKKIENDLECRGIVHDLSKFGSEEFAGFTRINQTARLYPYGSQEYKDSLASEGCVDVHYSHNTHHPEHWNNLSCMGFLDIIEMVCDWWAAWQSYGQQKTWTENLAIQRQRFDFTPGQWWLVEQVAGFLGSSYVAV